MKNTSHWLNQKEISSHILEMKKYPPLTREQEIVLFEKIRNGDLKAKHLLIYSNLRYVISMAKKYQGQGLSLNDLISEGNIGLIKAADRFDYNAKEPVRFLSYAVHWIKQCMTNSLHQNSRTIRVPTNMIFEIFKSNDEPLGDNVYDYSLKFPKVLSLDSNVDEDGPCLHETISDKNIVPTDDRIDNVSVNVQKSLKGILNMLRPTEQFVLIKSFGLDGYEAWTLQDIADRLDLTKERVRQIKEKSLKRLREKSFNLIKLLS